MSKRFVVSEINSDPEYKKGSKDFIHYSHFTSTKALYLVAIDKFCMKTVTSL
jgi:hypothetical protein